MSEQDARGIFVTRCFRYGGPLTVFTSAGVFTGIAVTGDYLGQINQGDESLPYGCKLIDKVVALNDATFTPYARGRIYDTPQVFLFVDDITAVILGGPVPKESPEWAED